MQSTTCVPVAAPRQTDRTFYRPELDALRFFAFLAVYVRHTLGGDLGATHAHLPALLGRLVEMVGIAGDFGVDLFFVLSSFLITELLTREERKTGHLDIRKFYLRRILRIWPLYFLMVALAWAAAGLDPTEGLTWQHVLAFLLFSGNWMLLVVPVDSIAAPLWSVSLEEQFYLGWPWLLRARTLRTLIRIGLAMVVVGMITRVVVGTHWPDRDYLSHNTLARMDGLAVGIMLAAALAGRLPTIPTWQRTVLLVGSLLALLAVAGTLGITALPVPVAGLLFGRPLVAIACGALVVSVLGAGGIIGTLMRQPVLTYLGRISFGLYVYHELVLKLFDFLVPGASGPAGLLLRFATGLLVSLIISAASYRWFEAPFLRLKHDRYTVVESRPV